MTVSFCGAKKRQGEGTCRLPAGWGTDHVGRGRCKLHGGCTPRHSKRGADHPDFKHGLYSQHLSEAETIEFEEWRRRFDLLKLSEEEVFGLFRLQKALCSPGALPLPALANAMLSLARTKLALRQALEGMQVEVRLEQEDVQALIQATVYVIAHYVPDDRVEDALREFRQLAGGSGGAG